MKATLVDLDGSIEEIEGPSLVACESVTRPVKRMVPVTKEDLAEAFRVRTVEEILSGRREPVGWVYDHVLYIRDWTAEGIVFRREK